MLDKAVDTCRLCNVYYLFSIFIGSAVLYDPVGLRATRAGCWGRGSRGGRQRAALGADGRIMCSDPSPHVSRTALQLAKRERPQLMWPVAGCCGETRCYTLTAPSIKLVPEDNIAHFTLRA